MSERLGNLGYLGLAKETTPGVAVTPTDWIPIYEESMTTNLNFVKDNPVVGLTVDTYQILQGQRDHQGKVTCMAEPNTAARLFDMLMTKGSGTGSGDPYTWPFTHGNATNSYTVDISTGNQVFRFCGVYAETIAASFKENEMQFDVDLSALLAFQGRTLASTPTFSSPNCTVVLDTSYDPSPVNGLAVGDTLQVYSVSGGSYTNFTIATITAPATLTTTTNLSSSAVTGDVVTIAPATPTFNNKTPFLWSRTQFKFGATASAAASAAQTQLETGSTWSITHNFENKAGAKRSGSFDPASLPRLLYGATLNTKKFFDDPKDEAAWADLSKTACQIVYYSGANDQLVVTFDNMRIDKVKPGVKSNAILYSEEDRVPQYDSINGEMFNVKVLNALATI